MILTTQNINLAGGIFCILVSFFMFSSYLKEKHSANLSIAMTFFWIGLSAYSFVYPFFLSNFNDQMLTVSYMVGISFIYIALLSGVEIMVFVSEKRIPNVFVIILRIVIIILAIVALSILYLRPGLPSISESGIVFWNISQLAAWIIALSAFLYGLVWCLVFYKSATFVHQRHARIKMFIISLDGLLLGTAELLLHTSSYPLQTALGHSLFLLAATITLLYYFMPKNLFS